MPSNINPQNINTTYPIAGQDNDTQGFRTNFTNIQNNFVVAASEITNLQSNLNPIVGGNIAGNLTTSGSITSRGSIFAATNIVATTSLTAGNPAANIGLLSVGGSIGYGPDTGIMASFVSNVSGYAYNVSQNLSPGGNAYVSYAAYNNINAFGEWGVNSSNYNAGSSGYVNNSLNLPNATFFYSDGGDMVFGTWTNNNIHFIANAQTNTGDAMLIGPNNNVIMSNTLSVASAIQFANLTTTQINAIAPTSRGMTVYNYTTGNIQVYNGTKWANVTLS